MISTLVPIRRERVNREMSEWGRLRAWEWWPVVFY
jgi:hypothetical protein